MQKTKLIIGEKLNLESYDYFKYHDEHVQAEAAQIFKSGNRSGRTDEQRKKDIINGLALQYSVIQELDDRGYSIDLPPRNVLHYDVLVDNIKIDIKSRGINAKFWQQ